MVAVALRGPYRHLIRTGTVCTIMSMPLRSVVYFCPSCGGLLGCRRVRTQHCWRLLAPSHRRCYHYSDPVSTQTIFSASGHVPRLRYTTLPPSPRHCREACVDCLSRKVTNKYMEAITPQSWNHYTHNLVAKH